MVRLARESFEIDIVVASEPGFALGYAVAGFVSDPLVENEEWLARA
jgi:hypothetical protein